MSRIRYLSQGTIWTPYSLPGLGLWLDANDISTVILSGTSVTEWRDKSGNSRNLTQGTVANQPTYELTALNSKPAITFDGVSDRMVSNFVDNYTPYTIAAVLKTNSAAQSIVCIGTTPDTLFSALPSNSGYQFGQAVQKTISTLSSLPNLVITQANITDRFAWLNGVSVTLGDGASFGGSGENFQIGCRRSNTTPSDFWSGSLSQLLLISTPLTPENRLRVEGHLAHKWGLAASLPSTHPYKNSPP